MRQFLKRRTHFALVVDEYGALRGLITLEDILEEIVGDVPEVGDPADPEAIPREDGTWLIDGMFPVDELKEMFNINSLPEEDGNFYQTIGGLIMIYLGRVPKEGDVVELDRFRFEVIDMDWRRVDKVLLTPLSPFGGPDEEGG